MSNLGSVHHLQGKLDLAKDCYCQALEIQDRLGDLHGASKTQNNLGLVYQLKGDLDLAADYFQKSLAAKEQLGDIHSAATTKINLGMICQLKGEGDLALAIYEEALETFESLGDMSGVSTAQNNLKIKKNQDTGDSATCASCSPKYNIEQIEVGSRSATAIGVGIQGAFPFARNAASTLAQNNVEIVTNQQ